MKRYNYYEWIENINDIEILKSRFSELNTIFLALQDILIEKYGEKEYLEVSKEAAKKACIDWLKAQDKEMN